MQADSLPAEPQGKSWQVTKSLLSTAGSLWSDSQQQGLREHPRSGQVLTPASLSSPADSPQLRLLSQLLAAQGTPPSGCVQQQPQIGYNQLMCSSPPGKDAVHFPTRSPPPPSRFWVSPSFCRLHYWLCFGWLRPRPASIPRSSRTIAPRCRGRRTCAPASRGLTAPQRPSHARQRPSLPCLGPHPRGTPPGSTTLIATCTRSPLWDLRLGNPTRHGPPLPTVPFQFLLQPHTAKGALR